MQPNTPVEIIANANGWTVRPACGPHNQGMLIDQEDCYVFTDFNEMVEFLRHHMPVKSQGLDLFEADRAINGAGADPRREWADDAGKVIGASMQEAYDEAAEDLCVKIDEQLNRDLETMARWRMNPDECPAELCGEPGFAGDNHMEVTANLTNRFKDMK